MKLLMLSSLHAPTKQKFSVPNLFSFHTRKLYLKRLKQQHKKTTIYFRRIRQQPLSTVIHHFFPDKIMDRSNSFRSSSNYRQYLHLEHARTQQSPFSNIKCKKRQEEEIFPMIQPSFAKGKLRERGDSVEVISSLKFVGGGK